MIATLLHSYLFAWLFVLGISLGSLGNLMVQSLTSGRWVVPVRPAWIAAARALPLVALLFIPVLLGVRWIYPWTDAGGCLEEAGYVDGWLQAYRDCGWL